MPMQSEGLYEEYAQTIYRYLFSLSGDADIAEELTQETFYQTLKQLNNYRGASSPQVWMCGIAKRLWFKELARRKRTVPLDEDQLSRMAAPDDLLSEYEQRDEKVTLYRAMQQLKPETREVIYLRLAGEFSFKEIGSIMGRSEVWARVTFYRGKEKLVQIVGGRTDG